MLSAAVGSYPYTDALLDGRVKPEGFEVDFVKVEPSIVAGFRRMMRGLEFDFCEMGITTYLSGWDSGNQMSAIPVFLSNSYPFSAIHVNTENGIETPEDLMGRRIGCRTYTVTSVVWARGMLQDRFGVDPDSITWVVNDHEHAEGFTWPKNVEFAEGADLAAMLSAGELDAGFGIIRGEAENVRPLFQDPISEEKAWFAESQIFPINHTITLKRALVASEPELSGKLDAFFTSGKTVFADRLASGATLTDAERAVARYRDVVGDDPVPYGIEACRPTLEALLRYSFDQHITNERLRVEDLFA